MNGLFFGNTATSAVVDSPFQLCEWTGKPTKRKLGMLFKVDDYTVFVIKFIILEDYTIATDCPLFSNEETVVLKSQSNGVFLLNITDYNSGTLLDSVTLNVNQFYELRVDFGVVNAFYLNNNLIYSRSHSTSSITTLLSFPKVDYPLGVQEVSFNDMVIYKAVYRKEDQVAGFYCEINNDFIPSESLQASWTFTHGEDL